MDRDDAELAVRFLEATNHPASPEYEPAHEVRRMNAEMVFYLWTMDRINARLAADRAQQIAQEANAPKTPPESAT